MYPRHLFIPPKTSVKWTSDPLRKAIENIDVQNSEVLRRALETDFTSTFIETLYKKAISTPAENINIEIKGETRSGKSSKGIFLGKLISYWHGLEFTEENILPNQSELVYKLKDAKWGETFLVDEQTTEAFGEGIYRETAQLGMNLNICAKMCNNLIFIYPPHFTMRNAPFGLETIAKDTRNKYIKSYYHDLRSKSFGYGGIWPRGYVILPKYQDQDYQNLNPKKWDAERLEHLKVAGYDFDSKLEQNYEKKKDIWINDIRNMDSSIRERKKQLVADKLAEDVQFLELRGLAKKEAYIKLLINRGKIIEMTKGEIASIANMASVLTEVNLEDADAFDMDESS